MQKKAEDNLNPAKGDASLKRLLYSLSSFLILVSCLTVWAILLSSRDSTDITRRPHFQTLLICLVTFATSTAVLCKLEYIEERETNIRKLAFDYAAVLILFYCLLFGYEVIARSAMPLE